MLIIFDEYSKEEYRYVREKETRPWTPSFGRSRRDQVHDPHYPGYVGEYQRKD